MKKLIILCGIMLCLPYFMNCEKVLKTETKTYDESFHYTLDALDGVAAENALLTKAELVSRLSLPSNARITRVEIQSLSCNVKVNPNNLAAKAICTGAVVKNVGSEQKLFEDKEISLSLTSGVWFGWIPVNTLVEQGVDMLKTQLAEWLVRYNTYTGESLVLKVAATSEPANSRLAMDFDLKIKATIQFEHCVTTSKLMGGEGMECEDAIFN